jgi:hypothetical protein
MNRTASQDIRHIQDGSPELAGLTQDEIVQDIERGNREQITPIKRALYQQVVRWQVSADFLIDAAVDCPGLTEHTVLGVPLHTTCGMATDRTEDLKDYDEDF